MPALADEATVARVRAEFPEAVIAMDEALKHVRIVATVDEVATPRGSTVAKARTYRLEYSRSGPLQKLVRIEGEEGTDGYQKRVLCQAPSYAFWADQAGKAPGLALMGFDWGLSEHMDQEISIHKYEVVLQFTRTTYPLRDMIAEPSFQVVGATTAVENGEEVVKFEVSHVAFIPRLYNPATKKTEPKHDLRRTRFTAVPGRGWAITRWEPLFGDRPWPPQPFVYGTLESAKDGRTPAVPARMVYHTTRSHATTVYTTFEFANLPDSEFTLASVGLPEVADPGTGSKRPWAAYALLAASAALLVLSIVLRWWSRGRPPGEPGPLVAPPGPGDPSSEAAPAIGPVPSLNENGR